jgi:hypothetical protein
MRENIQLAASGLLTDLREQAMYTCILCRFAVEPDDAVTPTPSGQCICLRCFARETDSERVMPKELRRELMLALETADANPAT